MCPVNPPSVLDGVARCSGLQRESLLRVDLEISSENHILLCGDYVIIVDLSFIVTVILPGLEVTVWTGRP